MSYVHYIKGTDIKVRTSKNNIYTQAVKTSYRGMVKYTCHHSLIDVANHINKVRGEYNRHPQDFNADYNPNEQGFFQVFPLEVKVI